MSNILKPKTVEEVERNIETLGEAIPFEEQNLNGIVLEDENAAREEGDVGPISPKKDDLNAAIEALSQQQNGKEVLLHIPDINNAIANLRRKPIFAQKNYVNKDNVWTKSLLKEWGFWNYRNFSKKEIEKLSVLGQRLFLHEQIGSELPRQFLIYIYQFGKRLEKRLVQHYGTENVDPFEHCSVHNCKLTYNHSHFNDADAVFFHLHLLKEPPTNLIRKNFLQRWVWLSDESPFNTFMVSKDKNIENYNNLFNWSMTYRAESDVPVPYGRTVPFPETQFLTPSNLDIFSKKNKSIAIMGSNCGGRNNRWSYVAKLQKYVNIDTYGHCGKYKCPGHFSKDCSILNDYKFYLAFENSNCKEYITEKVSFNTLYSIRELLIKISLYKMLLN